MHGFFALDRLPWNSLLEIGQCSLPFTTQTAAAILIMTAFRWQQGEWRRVFLRHNPPQAAVVASYGIASPLLTLVRRPK
jgi:hypothetical protein